MSLYIHIYIYTCIVRLDFIVDLIKRQSVFFQPPFSSGFLCIRQRVIFQVYQTIGIKAAGQPQQNKAPGSPWCEHQQPDVSSGIYGCYLGCRGFTPEESIPEVGPAV